MSMLRRGQRAHHSRRRENVCARRSCVVAVHQAAATLLFYRDGARAVGVRCMVYRASASPGRESAAAFSRSGDTMSMRSNWVCCFLIQVTQRYRSVICHSLDRSVCFRHHLGWLSVLRYVEGDRVILVHYYHAQSCPRRSPVTAAILRYDHALP